MIMMLLNFTSPTKSMWISGNIWYIASICYIIDKYSINWHSYILVCLTVHCLKSCLVNSEYHNERGGRKPEKCLRFTAATRQCKGFLLIPPPVHSPEIWKKIFSALSIMRFECTFSFRQDLYTSHMVDFPQCFTSPMDQWKAASRHDRHLEMLPYRGSFCTVIQSFWSLQWAVLQDVYKAQFQFWLPNCVMHKVICHPEIHHCPMVALFGQSQWMSENLSALLEVTDCLHVQGNVWWVLKALI